MRIVLVVLILDTWEICLVFCKHRLTLIFSKFFGQVITMLLRKRKKLNANDIVFTKAYLPCGTNQNNQDNTHGMALYHSLCRNTLVNKEISLRSQSLCDDLYYFSWHALLAEYPKEQLRIFAQGHRFFPWTLQINQILAVLQFSWFQKWILLALT